MAKTKTLFFCQNCGAQYAKWLGQCKSCNEWNTIVEEVIQAEEKRNWKQSTSPKKTNKALKINSRVARVYYKRGLSYLYKNNQKKARLDFNNTNRKSSKVFFPISLPGATK